jgi:hypothetical protein
MHREVLVDRLVTLNITILERPDVALDDYVAACKHMADLFTRWSVEGQHSAALQKMRAERGKSPSGMYRAPVVDEETR